VLKDIWGTLRPLVQSGQFSRSTAAGPSPRMGFVTDEAHRGRTAMADTKKSTKSTATEEPAGGFSETEQAAIKERAQELRAAQRGGRKKADDESAVLTTIAAMPQPDRGIAERLHAVITDVAPDLAPRLWYGQPAYAKEGKVVCFFQSAAKFKTRYGTLGFSEQANLDNGAMWPTAFAVTEWTGAVEETIGELVKKAVR
jgi:uncharacterized protein YdhG (YjbR/CyaY superfamily)